nr:hypothetical protein Itr_chr13CG10410 [Ipomoea trifida]
MCVDRVKVSKGVVKSGLSQSTQILDDAPEFIVSSRLQRVDGWTPAMETSINAYAESDRTRREIETSRKSP